MDLVKGEEVHVRKSNVVRTCKSQLLISVVLTLMFRHREPCWILLFVGYARYKGADFHVLQYNEHSL